MHIVEQFILFVAVLATTLPTIWGAPVIKGRQLQSNVPDNEPEPAFVAKRTADLDSQGASLGLGLYSGLGGINPYSYGLGGIGSVGLGGLGGYYGGGLGGLGGGLGGLGGLGGYGLGGYGLGGYGGLGGLGGYGGLGAAGLLGGGGLYSESDTREERIRRKLIKTLDKINKQAASQGNGQIEVVQGLLTPYGYGNSFRLGGLGGIGLGQAGYPYIG